MNYFNDCNWDKKSNTNCWNIFRKDLPFDITTRSTEISNDELFQCKFCDEDFLSKSDKEEHETIFHSTINQVDDDEENTEAAVNELDIPSQFFDDDNEPTTTTNIQK